MFLPQTAQQDSVPDSSGVLRGGPLVAGVEVSVLISEAHQLAAQPTKNAIESGALMSDHVIIQPYAVSIVYEASNAGNGAMVAKDVFETFKNMLEARELLELITEHYAYDNMVLTSVSPLHAAPYKGRLQCTATLERVNQIKIETTGRNPKSLKGTASKTGSAQVNGGQQEGKPVSGTLGTKILDKAKSNQ